MTLDSDEPRELNTIDTTNYHMVCAGINQANTTYATTGHARFVKVAHPGALVFREQQQIYRLAAWLLLLADTLPSDETHHTFEQIINAIKDE